MGLTFKTDYPTGRYRTFSHIHINIKLNKQAVGTISWQQSMAGHSGMRVTLHVKDSDSVCGWKNVTLMKTFDGFSDRQQGKLAKEWVKSNWDKIANQYQIHFLTNQQPELL